MWLLVLLSCISKTKHELVEVQLDATRTALSARNAQCYLDVSAPERPPLGLDEQVGESPRVGEVGEVAAVRQHLDVRQGQRRGQVAVWL